MTAQRQNLSQSITTEKDVHNGSVRAVNVCWLGQTSTLKLVVNVLSLHGSLAMKINDRCCKQKIDKAREDGTINQTGPNWRL